MKKIHFTAVVICAITLLSSCADKNEPMEDKPVYNLPENSATTTVTVDTVQTVSGEHVFLSDFKGVGESATIGSNASLINNSMSSIVCTDEDGTLYYVNYGTYEDNYIYSYKDGERALLVDKICNYINYYDGSLYFLVSENPPEALPWSWGGELYRYQISTKSCEKLLDEKICNLSAQNGTLYFCSEKTCADDGTELGNEWYSMKIGDTEPVKMGKLLPFFYGEYQLAFSDEGKKMSELHLISENEDVKLTGEYDFYNRRFAIFDDTLYIGVFTDDNTSALASVNLADGTQKLYKATEITPNGRQMNDDVSFNFAVLNGKVYAASQSNILVYKEDIESFDGFIFDRICYSDIYTDGKYLYGLQFSGEPYDYHTNSIVRISDGGSLPEVVTND